MGKACCENKIKHLFCHRELEKSQRIVLLKVLAVSLVLVATEFSGAYISDSHGLLADALHIFGHVIMVSLSLFAISRGARWKARAALTKGLFMAVLAIASLFGSVFGFFSSVVPQAESMGYVGIFAFVCNLLCLSILWKHRKEDLNMRSTWLCAANDLITDFGIVCASLVVSITHLGWPDYMLGAVFSTIVLWSSVRITMQSIVEMKKSVDVHSKIRAFHKPQPINLDHALFERVESLHAE